MVETRDEAIERALRRFLALRTDAPNFVRDFSMACANADEVLTAVGYAVSEKKINDAAISLMSLPVGSGEPQSPHSTEKKNVD